MFGESKRGWSQRSLPACLGHELEAGALRVGETLEERDRGEAVSVIAAQLDPVIERVGTDGLAEAVIAYEPVWAIGTGESATPAQAEEMHRPIRGLLGEYAGALALGAALLLRW
ncbi:MAG: triose-phosphate isomerase [Gammaproteobacteria bacterium]|nr:triose-phosphate isomerase [Gammaproteobacteria bacterium]